MQEATETGITGAGGTPSTPAPPVDNTLTVTPLDGAHFELDEVSTAKGQQSLGEVPILVWDDVQKMLAHYGDQGILDMSDGTSLRVSFQAIARRFKIAGKSNNDIATAQNNFKPGKRAGGVSTPVSRAAKASKSAAEKVGGDVVAALLERIASGNLSAEDIAALTGASA